MAGARTTAREPDSERIRRGPDSATRVMRLEGVWRGRLYFPESGRMMPVDGIDTRHLTRS